MSLSRKLLLLFGSHGNFLDVVFLPDCELCRGRVSCSDPGARVWAQLVDG